MRGRINMIVYHVVTERPMKIGQVITFDDNNHSGVYTRVYEKLEIVRDIYEHPEKYDEKTLEHHTAVALRELAIEEVRKQHYPNYPSRMSCLYVSKNLKEAKKWADFFVELGRPTYHIVKLQVEGNCFVGDATKCFRGTSDKEKNLKLGRLYWESHCEDGICEMLVDGRMTVLEIVEELNKNI